MNEISKKEIQKLSEKILDIEDSLDTDNKREILKSLEQESSKEDFWKNQQHAQDVSIQIADLNGEISKIDSLKEDLNTLSLFLEEPLEESTQYLSDTLSQIEEDIKEFESLKFLSGKYDSANASLSIHAGQGGTEAEDWAEMLFRMYTMYLGKREWKYNVTNVVKGTQAGIATITLEISGKYAYGVLKQEHGTHRLVRLSPYNAQNLRQTSFAAVEVIPILKDLGHDIEIPDKDILFKATKSGGPGGQNVNKTSSAVQIAHIPTGIVVNCSEERSQLQNREKAMQILKAKLWKIVEENRLKEISEIKGDYKLAGWGNQIRNYILHPYKLVKDLRTNVESNNPESVLDGNIEEFLEAQLRIQ